MTLCNEKNAPRTNKSMEHYHHALLLPPQEVHGFLKNLKS